jgi:hypothetical protein
MAHWEATRPGSFTTNYATIVGCGNAFDVSSVIPSTTVCSWTCNSTGTDKIVLKGWGAADYAPDSYYVIGVRMGCRSMGTMYMNVQYSTNGGGAWTTIVASYGRTTANSDTFTASIAATQDPRSLWLRIGATTTHSRGRALLYDAWLVGSYSQDFIGTIGDNVGVTDNEAFLEGGAASNWADVTGDTAGLSDSVNRYMTIVRGVVS